MTKNEECDECYGVSCPHWMECFPELKNDIKQLKAEIKGYKTALDKLAKLGNEPEHGNSIGNMIAQKALKGDIVAITNSTRDPKGGK